MSTNTQSDRAEEPPTAATSKHDKSLMRHALVDMVRSNPSAIGAIHHLRDKSIQLCDSFLGQDQRAPESHSPSPSPAKATEHTDGKLQSISKIDESQILGALEEKGIMIDESSKAQLFLTCTELEQGFIGRDEFNKNLRSLLANNPSADPTTQQIQTACIAILKLVDMYQALQEKEEVAKQQVRTAAAAENLRQKYLSGFQTAKGLEPESVKIIVAAKEIVENAFDDHELVHLRADSLSIREFLQEETLPFIREMVRRGVDDIPVDLIRRKRAELKEKLEIQRRNVKIHFQRVERGIEDMGQETYHVKTNHLPRYAAASALETVLRVYYAWMGQFDPEDIMADMDRTRVLHEAEERIASIKMLFKRYGDKRQTLIGGKTERPDERLLHRQRFNYIIYDAGSRNDSLCPKVEIDKVASLFPSDQATTAVSKNGEFYYQQKSLLGTDHTISPGQRLLQATRDDVSARLVEGGLVWQQHFQPHTLSIGIVCEALQGADLSSKLENTKITISSPMPRTIPLVNLQPDDLKNATVPCGYQFSTPGTPESQWTKLYFILCSIAGEKLVGEWIQDSSCAWIPVASSVIPVPAYRCEILLDSAGFEWVSASDGHIPERAISFSSNRENTIPVYMACVDVSSENTVMNPASVVYEVQDGGKLRYQCARYRRGDEPKDMSEYKVLCAMQSDKGR